MTDTNMTPKPAELANDLLLALARCSEYQPNVPVPCADAVEQVCSLRGISLEEYGFQGKQPRLRRILLLTFNRTLINKGMAQPGDAKGQWMLTETGVAEAKGLDNLPTTAQVPPVAPKAQESANSPLPENGQEAALDLFDAPAQIDKNVETKTESAPEVPKDEIEDLRAEDVRPATTDDGNLTETATVEETVETTVEEEVDLHPTPEFICERCGDPVFEKPCVHHGKNGAELLCRFCFATNAIRTSNAETKTETDTEEATTIAGTFVVEGSPEEKLQHLEQKAKKGNGTTKPAASDPPESPMLSCLHDPLVESITYEKCQFVGMTVNGNEFTIAWKPL